MLVSAYVISLSCFPPVAQRFVDPIIDIQILHEDL